MKRILFVISFMGLLPMICTNSPAFAGDSNALINKLVEKGVISQSEADELYGESKDLSDIEKALKGIKLEGTYFLEFSKTDTDDATTSDTNSFKVNRAYITIKKEFTPWFSSRVTSDIVDSDEGNEFRLKYAYGKFDFKKLCGKDLRLESEFGLVHTASDDYDSALWPYRAQGKHYLDRHSIMSSADYGLNAHLTFGEMDEDFKKEVSKKYAAKWGGIWAGIYNGAGYGDPDEANDNKVFEALAYVRPFNAIGPLKGLRVGYHIARGESNTLLSGGAPDQYPDWDIDQVMVSYQNKDFTVMYQNYSGKGEDKSSDQNDREGYNVAGFVKMPFNKDLRAFGRYDVYDRNENQPNDKVETLIYGASYDLAKGVMAWAAMEDTDNENPSTADMKQTQIGLAVEF